MRIEQHRLVIGGVTTYADDMGEGPVLVIVHGWAAGRILWKSSQRRLCTSRRVVTFDLRGHGDAGKPAQGPYTIPRFAQDLLGVLDALHVERAAMVGHSMGGMICQEFALAHPDRVEKLVLSGTSLGQGSLDTQEARDFLDMLRNGGYADFIAFGADMWFHGSVAQEVVDLSLDTMRRCPEYVAVAAMEGLLSWTSRGRVEDIVAPALVLAGAEDATQPRERVRELAEALPHGTLQLLAGVGHDCYLEAPDAYLAAIEAFL